MNYVTDTEYSVIDAALNEAVLHIDNSIKS